MADMQLRELIDSDLPQIYDFHNDAAAVRMALVPPRDWPAFTAHWTRLRSDGSTIVRVVARDAAVCGYGFTFARAGLRELGYWVGRAYWGQGHATLLARALVRLDATRPLHGVVAEHNLASRRVLEKCGFQLVGTVDDLPEIDGHSRSGYMLRLDSIGIREFGTMLAKDMKRTTSGRLKARRPVKARKVAGAPRPANTLVGRTLATDVLHRLRGDIIACNLLPGSRLRFESLRSAYRVSFSTLREGLSRLASEGLVVADGQRGFRVAPASIKEMMDLTEARVLVEREVLRLSIARGDDAWRLVVHSAFQRMEQLPEQQSTSTEWNSAHAAFHEALGAACDSAVLKDIRSKLFDRGQRYRRLAAAARTSNRSNPLEHREIMAAALGGDSEQACLLIERHIRRTAAEAAALGDRLAVPAAG